MGHAVDDDLDLAAARSGDADKEMAWMVQPWEALLAAVEIRALETCEARTQSGT
jgi:hypothetical protein